jgi:hypothetical protein
MVYKIETGIPIPDGEPRRAGRPSSYPFGDLAVGESVFIPSRHRYISHERGLALAIHSAKAKYNINLVVFPWIKDGQEGFRIFRDAGNARLRTNRPRHVRGYEPEGPEQREQSDEGEQSDEIYETAEKSS